MTLDSWELEIILFHNLLKPTSTAFLLNYKDIAFKTSPPTSTTGFVVCQQTLTLSATPPQWLVTLQNQTLFVSPCTGGFLLHLFAIKVTEVNQICIKNAYESVKEARVFSQMCLQCNALCWSLYLSSPLWSCRLWGLRISSAEAWRPKQQLPVRLGHHCQMVPVTLWQTY